MTAFSESYSLWLGDLFMRDGAVDVCLRSKPLSPAAAIATGCGVITDPGFVAADFGGDWMVQVMLARGQR